MSLTTPYPAELLRVARKVVWYQNPEETLADLMTFLTHLMVYGSADDVSVAEGYVPAEEFRKVLENSPAGVFTQDVWEKWHEALGNPTLSDAILDRLVHNAHKVTMKGESMRKTRRVVRK